MYMSAEYLVVSDSICVENEKNQYCTYNSTQTKTNCRIKKNIQKMEIMH